MLFPITHDIFVRPIGVLLAGNPFSVATSVANQLLLLKPSVVTLTLCMYYAAVFWGRGIMSGLKPFQLQAVVRV